MTDDGRGTHPLGAEERPQGDTAWSSGRVEMDLENLGHRRRAADVPHGLSGQGGSTDLPGGRMPRVSGDKDGDMGTFYAPSCTGHRGHFGVGKHPPPTVPPIRHAGPLAYTDRKSPCHHTVRQGSGLEEAVISGGVIEVEHGEGL